MSPHSSPEIIAAHLTGPGWCVVPGYLSEDEFRLLRDVCHAMHAKGAFHSAGIGNGTAEIRSEIRGDQIYWIDEAQAAPALQAVLDKLETLRLTVNQQLYLGLFDVELHFAIFPPGTDIVATLIGSRMMTDGH